MVRLLGFGLLDDVRAPGVLSRTVEVTDIAIVNLPLAQHETEDMQRMKARIMTKLAATTDAGIPVTQGAWLHFDGAGIGGRSADIFHGVHSDESGHPFRLIPATLGG